MTASALTPYQLILGRRLLRWSRDRLAAKMGSSNYAIALFEKEGIAKRAFSTDRAREIIEAAGVEFVAGNGGGAGLRLRCEN